MPEYLAPGVYVEEVSFRARSIEGVPTSTTGYAGMTATGPVQYVVDGSRGPRATEPRLVSSFTEFERIYGGLDPLIVDGDERLPYLAHAARAFFVNGGKRLYVSRVFVPNSATDAGVASRAVSVSSTPGTTARWRARWPGRYGEDLVTVRATRGKNVAFTFPAGDPLNRDTWGPQARSATEGTVVEIVPAGTTPPVGNANLAAGTLAVVHVDPATLRQTFADNSGNAVTVPAGAVLQIVELEVSIRVTDERTDAYAQLGAHPSHRRYVGKILQADDPADEDAVVWLDYGGYNPSDPTASKFSEPGANAIDLMVALQRNPTPRLTGGNDGKLATADDLAGKAASLDDATVKATGLEALGEIDDIAIVALPDGGTYGDAVLSAAAADRLISHAERERYRIAVIDGPAESSLSEIRAFRSRFDSKYAALYHPWIEILDPTERAAQGAPPRRLLLPPSGFVTGIYARSDVQRGVFKAPANEVVQGLTRLEANINKARQEVLNPEGINALRFFPGRGNRVWGARTMSSDPEWKYVNVRRLFVFLEHSIDKSTQWAVFEPNNERLWASIRQTVEDFLLVQWRDGALMGATPDEAYFVRCDRTTMTQNDLDNGRLICLIGVAPTKPAEFVIFRIGQWTADATMAS
jgi:phage tail sheath protein FI